MKIINGDQLKVAINKGYEALNNNKEAINKLNVFPVPDGDTGTNMSLTMKSAVDTVNEVENPTVGDCAKALGRGSLMGARGNSGVILSQIFRGISNSLKGKDNIEIVDINDALISAKETAYKAVMKPTEGTILTVTRKMAEFSEKNNSYDDVLDYLNDVLKAGKIALEETPDMLPRLKEAEVVDAGGQGLLVIFEGVIRSLEDRNIDDIIVSGEITTSEPSFKELDSSDKKYEYEVELILKTDNPDAKAFYKEIKDIGNAVTNKTGKDSLEVKSHTNNPGLLLEKAIEKGHLIRISVKNILLHDVEEIPETIEENIPAEAKEYGFVAVSLGDGFDNIFKELGVDQVISGGQTMNPSTADIYNAVEKINAETVYVLPNNKNIIMSAKQVNELSDKNVVTIESRTIPQGFIALLDFNPNASADENQEIMSGAIKEIQTIELTYSVRDTKHDGKEIKEGDLLGLLDGELVANGKDKLEIINELIEKTQADESSLITIYYGEDVTEKEALKLQEALEEIYKAEIEVIYGGQPLYYYIISVE